MFECGLVIAEMLPGTEPRARHFPLSQPDHRRPQPRHSRCRSRSEVWLIDHRAACRGSGQGGHGRPRTGPSIREPSCNQLIRQGATLVQNAADVLEAVRPIQPGFASPRATYEPAEPRWVDGDAGALGLVEELLALRPYRSTRSSACPCSEWRGADGPP